MEGFIDVIEAYADAPVDAIVQALIDGARAFSDNNLRDDIAIVVARFP
jgi:serine phosphatase RsbU (regulator of sigma subunit)